MYTKILVPLDGSRSSEGVLPYARSLARGFNVAVELLRVNDPAPINRSSTSNEGGDYLKKIAVSFSGVAVVKCTVEPGEPAGVIVDLAAAQPGTLIAMATHGYSGATRWFLGSIAEKVLRAATSHLLLVRPGDGDSSGEARLNTLLAALDGSELAEEVLPTVSEIAPRLNLEVMLVRVTKRVYPSPPDALLPIFGANIGNLKELWEQQRLEANKYLSERVEHLRALGLTNVSSLLIDGGVDGAAGEIVDFAKQIPHSLVVMSTHGESGIKRWIVGSVTERVVRHSNRPVLVIRPPS
jgi:nucleotide-binding universal stress UspA family protein